LEWEQEVNKIVVDRAGRFSFEDIHRRLCGTRTPKKRTIEEMKEGIRQYVRGQYVRERHARD